MNKLEALFEPIVLDSVKISNRIVMPAMHTNLAGPDGQANDRIINYYSARARGMTGLIIIEATVFDNPRGKLGLIHLRIDKDTFIPALNALAEEIKGYGTGVFIQLNHAGARTSLAATEGIEPVSASEIATFDPGVLAKPLTHDGINEIISSFAEGAKRAQIAGFDGVEVHGAHGYLVAEFMSPFTNKRTDRYGGSLENRLRFPLELLERTREKVGSKFAISFRLSADEFVPGGMDLKESMIVAKRLEDAGVNVIHVTAGTYVEPSSFLSVAPACFPPGHLVYLAEKIKKAVDIPVIAVGRINDPRKADEIIRKGQADLVSMGRALIADPEMPSKAYSGEFNAIRKCLGCLIGCIERTDLPRRLGCTINPWVGKESDLRALKEHSIGKPKKVLVVGGGPAGMEAAIDASLKGHEVTLCEKSPVLGGQLLLAGTPPYKLEIQDLDNCLTYQIKELGIDTRLSKEVDLNFIQEVKPDVVIAATGAVPIIPKISGVNREIVHTAWDVLANRMELNDRIVIVGGGQVGLETAEFLAGKSASITVIEMLPDVGVDMFSRNRFFLLNRLSENGVKVQANTKLLQINDDSISVLHNGQEKESIPVDEVVLAVGSAPNRKLVDELMSTRLRFYTIGDCLEPRKLYQAIHEGSIIGSSI